MTARDLKLYRAARRVRQQRRQQWYDWLDANGNTIYHPESDRLHDRWNHAHAVASRGYHQLVAEYSGRYGWITNEQVDIVMAIMDGDSEPQLLEA